VRNSECGRKRIGEVHKIIKIYSAQFNEKEGLKEMSLPA